MQIHNVYFWLKPTVTDAERRDFEEAVRELVRIPHIASAHWGTPAATPVRPVTDNTFDLSLTLLFESMAAHDAYQDAPGHHAFVERCSPLWERVLVYDTACPA